MARKKQAPADRSTIPAAEFKAGCLALMDRVRERGEEYIVTKHGEPVARLVPVAPETARSPFGWIAGSVTEHGDIVTPLDEPWEAAAGE
ncbi:MAG: type II toxin-antitoxin system prevent-host-death family antitoxin [Vicinamibacterales bacterium]|nr:type II toxin-antitoxin system prevent-host-death family antitoxin [Vicinamibacterales bacterium]